MLSTAFLTLALTASSPYENASLHAFVAAASDRVVDGVAQSHGPVASAGLVFIHPAGPFGSSVLSHFDSNGAYLPRDTRKILESAAGWQWQGEQYYLSLAILDYRYTAEAGSGPYPTAATQISYQGVALQYGFGHWRAEIGIDRDQPYYYTGSGTTTLNVQRMALDWNTTPGERLGWFGGVGARRIDDSNLIFASFGVRGEWLGLEWQLMASHSRAHDFPVPAAATGSHVQLRIGRTFRLGSN